MLFACCLFVALAGGLATVGAPAGQPAKPKDGPLEMKFVFLPKGTFYMGGGGSKAGKKIEIQDDFEIAVHTVTQGQWQAVTGNNPSSFSRHGEKKDKVKDIKDEELKLFPVEHVSWDEVQQFIKKLNEKEAGHGYGYRLPTEAEWEYACRGGAASEDECSFDFYFDKPTNDLSSQQANCQGDRPAGKADKGPFLGRPTKVGSYPPNKLGLYDMSGNVFQWCADLYDPKDSNRVIRGGNWYSPAFGCRAAFRFGCGPSAWPDGVGFRLARVASSGK
jgi:formylglycine-generating enzyme required for sulfatase activity